MAESGHLVTVVWHDQSKRLIVWSCRVVLVVILSLLLRILWSPSDTSRLPNGMKQQQETRMQYKLAQEGETRAGSGFIRYVAFEILENATTKTVTVQRWAELLATDGKFSDSLTQVLKDAPFSAYFFETKGVTTSSASKKPFELVIIDAPHLSSFAESRPDPDSFAEHLENCSSSTTCCAFPNLGGDAMLVAPIQCNPNIPLVAYSHLAKFVREAPMNQVRDLWQLTAKTYREQWTGQPLWLSTEGSGVAWLHMRLDSRPKYYHYQPFAIR